MLSLLGGFSAGLVHVASGPDHWAAVAPLAVDAGGRERRIAPWKVGAAWGLGHGLAVAVVAALGQALAGRFRVEEWSAWAERSVGFLLIGLALWTWRRASTLALHEHRHLHGGAEHSHLHVHHEDRAHLDEPPAGRHGHAHGLAGVAIGLLHGVAGVGHWVAASPTLLLAPGQAARYVLGYWIAAVAAMALFSTLVGRIAGRRGPGVVRHMLRASAVLAAGVGLFWLGGWQ
jgi:uncharacterized membrane protein YfcA